MGAIISLGDQWIKISNGACEKVFDDAITVAEHHAENEVEKDYVARLKHERQGFFSGYCPNFESLFPTFEERQFWIRCFRDAGRWLHEGKLDNPPNCGASPAIWIFHTYWCAQLLEGTFIAKDELCVFKDEDTVLRAKERARALEEYRIKHEQVVGEAKAEAEKMRKRIKSYCARLGFHVPAGLDRRSPARYSLIRLDADPPRLVALTWDSQEGVVNYVKSKIEPQFGERASEFVDILDLHESKQMRYVAPGCLEICGPISFDD